MEYWLWPPRNHVPLDIGSTSDTEPDTALDITPASNVEEGGENFDYEKNDKFDFEQATLMEAHGNARTSDSRRCR